MSHSKKQKLQKARAIQVFKDLYKQYFSLTNSGFKN